MPLTEVPKHPKMSTGMTVPTAWTRPFKMYKWNWEVPRRETYRSQTATDVVVRLNSPWAPGHFCGVSIVLVVVVVLLFSSCAGTHQIRDQSHALEDRNNSNNSLEVHTPNSFIHLLYNSLHMNIVDMHSVILPQVTLSFGRRQWKPPVL